jgi:hypothetical protein
MKTRSIFTLIFWLIILSSQGQLFQNNYGHFNHYFHDVSTDQFHYNSEHLVIAGNFFQTNFTKPLAEVIRIDHGTGNIIWQNTYIDPQGIYMNVRVFDIVAYVGENGMDLLALTGSVTISNTNCVFIAKIDEYGNFLQAMYYENVVNGVTHSQGLSIIHTLNGPAGRGFVVGGFGNMDYDHATHDTNKGFVLYVEEGNLLPVWAIDVISNNPLPSYEYDMVSDVTETNEGYFITGSIGAMGNLSLQQAVLCLGINFNGDIRWNKSYLVGNSRDVGVDAYYDQATEEIYLLANYSYTHYFGVTVINDISGYIETSKSWYTYDWNNLNKYGFKILESANNNESALVVAGYFRDGQYFDEYGNLIQSATIPFAYEFDKASGDQVSANYFYNIPYQDPGFSDYFDFWNAQMPLIYYPEMALRLNDETGYFITGYRGDSTILSINVELIKTELNHKNLCYRTPIVLLHDTVIFIPVDCVIEPANPGMVFFSLEPMPNAYQDELSCPDPSGTGQIDESIVELHPNPAKDRLYFSIPEQGLVYYSIYNAKGLKTGEGKLNGGESVIDISSLSTGLYFVKLIMNDKYMIRKVIIE